MLTRLGLAPRGRPEYWWRRRQYLQKASMTGSLLLTFYVASLFPIASSRMTSRLETRPLVSALLLSLFLFFTLATRSPAHKLEQPVSRTKDPKIYRLCPRCCFTDFYCPIRDIHRLCQLCPVSVKWYGELFTSPVASQSSTSVESLNIGLWLIWLLFLASK